MNRTALIAIVTVLLILAAAGFFLVLFPNISKSLEKEYTVLSPVYYVDRIYMSMKGPSSSDKLKLPGVADNDLIWITGFKAIMVGEDQNEQISQEFMCHSNLDINIKKHKELMGWKKNNPSRRLFTLSQGQYSIKFPEGYGIPIFGSEALKLTTQVLNLNDTENKHKVRHKVTLNYIEDKDLKEPLKPLMQIAAVGLKLVEGKDGYYNIERPNEDIHGSSCLLGESASGGGVRYRDKFGRKFTGHWVVEPGKEVNYTNTTRYLSVPYDTTIHYIAVHLHPFAETLELVDITSGETVFRSNVTAPEDRIGITHVEYFESKEGLPLYKDHEYQLISTYNNTSDMPQDSMAVMYIYVLDKEFNHDYIVSSHQD